MSNSNQNTAATPKSALEVFRDWKELIAFLALTLTSILGGILGKDHARVQIVSWILAVLFVAIGVYVVHRKRKRTSAEEQREKLWADRAAQRKPGTAFRSLAPFEERDQLPGRDRVNEARMIATRIGSDDFRFGVVCGDSGSGKTSLLRSEVMRCLRESNLEVAYVRNQRRLETAGSEHVSPAERLAAELTTLSKNHIGANTSVLILDQFEEWFIEYPEPPLRVQIGRFLREVSQRSRPVRIVCAVRREFLVDFHDLRDALDEPLLANNLFRVKNFTIDQAVNIIRECAQADGLRPEDSFAETVAHDLSEGGEVRPPELQIVCTHLAGSGSLDTSNYRQAGGTAGILAHYIEEALSLCRAPNVGARLLRALCDFPARAKRKPKTADELTADVNNDGSASQSNLSALVRELAQHFVLARILDEEQRKDRTAFALMHDYLVDAVQLATGDVSTKTEEANQLLRYYVAEQRGTIPFRRFRFIRKFAERRYLKEPAARRLIRRSIIKPLFSAGTTVIAALILAAGLYLIRTAQRQWDGPILLGRHWADDESGSVNVQVIPVTNKVVTGSGPFVSTMWPSVGFSPAGKVLALIDSASTYLGEGHFPAKPYSCIWDAKTGQRTPVYGGRRAIIGPSFKSLLIGNTLLNLPTMEQRELPTLFTNVRFSDSENWLLWEEPKQIFIYSLATQNIGHRAVGVPAERGGLEYKLAQGGNHLLVPVEGNRALNLYDTNTGTLIAALKGDEEATLRAFAINDSLSEVCTLARFPSGSALINLWNLRTGQPIRKFQTESLGSPLPEEPKDVQFSRDGSHVVLRSGYLDSALLVLRESDLKPIENLPTKGLRAADAQGALVFFWHEKDSVKIWDGSLTGMQTLVGLNIGERDRLIVDARQQRAIVWRKARAFELWDLATAKLISNVSYSSPTDTVRFTLDDTAVLLVEEGGVMSLFDASNGAPLVQHLATSGVEQVYYDRDCGRFHLWNKFGQVFRYTEGRKYFWKFVPSRSCP